MQNALAKIKNLSGPRKLIDILAKNITRSEQEILYKAMQVLPLDSRSFISWQRLSRFFRWAWSGFEINYQITNPVNKCISQLMIYFTITVVDFVKV